MMIPTGPVGTDAEGYPTLYPSRLRRYGAAPEHDRFRGCPAQYRAVYVTCACGHDRQDHDGPGGACGGDVPMDGCAEGCTKWRSSVPKIVQPNNPAEFGGAVHAALFHMEEHACGPEEALQHVWSEHLDVEAFTEATELLNKYLTRGGPMTRYSTLAVEIELTAVLYEDEDFGPVYFAGVIDWLGLDINESQIVHHVDYKGLALDTLLPTPTGWAKMGEVQPGDRLIGGDGRPCSVTAKSEIHMNPCYRIVFDDGSSVVCDHEHRWVVKAGRTGGRRAPLEPVEMTTQELVDRGVTDRHGVRDVRIENVELDLPEVDLPIDPYVLGCWLGDGTKAAGVVSSQDQRIFDEIEARGYRVGPVLGHTGRTIYGLRSKLRETGLLGLKRVPDVYTRGSRQQRLDLLRGLMDTDGYWNPTRQRAVMNTTQTWQAEVVQELVVSLGWKATTFDTTARGFGIESPAKQVWFTPTEPVFLARPPTDFRPSEGARPLRRMVQSIDPVDTVPTQCVTVDSPDHRYLATEDMIPTHNSNRQPLNADEVRRDLQMRGYDWLVHQCWQRLGLPGRPHTIAHMDGLRWNDVEVRYTDLDRAQWAEWAAAIARKILRDTKAPEVLGPGCRWCPRRFDCAAYRTLPGVGESIAARSIGTTLDELWSWRQEAADVRKTLDDGIADVDRIFADRVRDEGPLTIDDTIWQEEPVDRDVLDMAQLHRVLGDTLFYEVAGASKKAIEQLAKAHPELASAMWACFDRMTVSRRVVRKKVER